jgi:hypothetical protein
VAGVMVMASFCVACRSVVMAAPAGLGMSAGEAQGMGGGTAWR